ncbi:MAG: 6-bladed beta-propeller [Balneolia bacterium]|nr:6-bladed beta-propeller [Balneolia bacterium]
MKKLKIAGPILLFITTVVLIVIIANDYTTSNPNTTRNDKVGYNGYFPSEDVFIDTSQLMRVRADKEEDFVAVWNQGNQSLYQFDQSGNYIRTVTTRGSGPGEVGYVSGIALGSGKIVLNDQSKFMFHVFDYKGNFEQSVQYRETILLDIAYNHPFVIGQNALSISGDVNNEQTLAYIYNLETGETVGSVKIDLNHIDAANRMVNLVADEDHFLIVPKAGYQYFKVEARSGELVSMGDFEGYDFNSLQERLADLYGIDNPNLIIDMEVDQSGYMLALNGTARKILSMDKDFKLNRALEFESLIPFYENEYLRSISIGGSQLYVLNGQGDGVIHSFNY